MIRLPDWAYNRLSRTYLAQRRIRLQEADQRMTDDDRRLREWVDRMREAHDMGTCGGGCTFVPCVPHVDTLQ